MFIHDFIEIALPAAEVRARLLDDGGHWITPLAGAAYSEGEALRLRLGPAAEHGIIAKQVRLEIGTPYERHDLLVVPIEWRATGPARLFPALEGDLTIAPLGEDHVQMSLHGRYEPPLGIVGHTADALVMHRIAEACVRAFLTKVAKGLTDSRLTGRALVQPRVAGPAARSEPGWPE